MDIASITNIADGMDKIKSAISIAMKSRGKADDDEQVNKVLEELSDVQDALFFLRNEVNRLQTENARLDARLRETEAWERKISAYRLIESDGGSVVYHSDSEPYHYICPVCAQKEKIQILQNKKNDAGEFHCPGCERDFPVTHPPDMKHNCEPEAKKANRKPVNS